MIDIFLSVDRFIILNILESIRLQVFARLLASDEDSGYAGLLYYGGVDKYFGIHAETGDIYVAEVLSDLFRENIEKQNYMEYSLHVSACDCGQPMKCTDATVLVNVTQSNAHAPHFENVCY